MKTFHSYRVVENWNKILSAAKNVKAVSSSKRSKKKHKEELVHNGGKKWGQDRDVGNN